MKIETLYEDDDYVVAEKPSGLMVHPDGRNNGPFLTDWFVEHYPKSVGVGEDTKIVSGKDIKKPGVVHRLDADTSGVIVLARNQEAFLHLKNQFQNREVQKTYIAFVYGGLSEDKGVIDRPIGKSAKNFRLRSAQRGARGKLRDALTKYIVLKRLKDMTFVEVHPQTGRTHQIRVHFKSIHHPVVCDPLYAPKMDCMGFSRLALHAKSIRFKGLGGKKIFVESQIPNEFENLLADVDLF